MKEFIKLLRTKLRLHFGLCPECNSDAPEIDDCHVCEGYRAPYPPTEETKKRWMERFKEEGIVIRGGKAQAEALGRLIKEGHRNSNRDLKP